MGPPPARGQMRSATISPSKSRCARPTASASTA